MTYSITAIRGAAPLRQADDGNGELRRVVAQLFAFHQRRGRFGRSAAEHLAPDVATGSTRHAYPEMAVEKVLDVLVELFEKDYDDYLKFWGQFGRPLKEGVSSD
jgi:hypothetical protein